MQLDYFYGSESSQFSFLRIPRLLMTGKRFTHLSTDARLLYGLMLDRMGLSQQNGWMDSARRVYIYFTLEDAMEQLGCGHNKATQVMRELDKVLIERRKQGQGKPCRIYVKNIFRDASASGGSDCPKAAVKTSEKGQSRLPETGTPDCRKEAANDTNKSDTDPHASLSVYPSPEQRGQTAATKEQRIDAKVREQLEYDVFAADNSNESRCICELIRLISDVMQMPLTMLLRINEHKVPVTAVQEVYRTLTQWDLEHVYEQISHAPTEIRNMRGYLIACQYNSPMERTASALQRWRE